MEQRWMRVQEASLAPEGKLGAVGSGRTGRGWTPSGRRRPGAERREGRGQVPRLRALPGAAGLWPGSGPTLSGDARQSAPSFCFCHLHPKVQGESDPLGKSPGH